MNRTTPRFRRTLLALAAAAALLGACEEEAPDLPEAPPAQDGSTEAPSPEEGLDVDEDVIDDG